MDKPIYLDYNATTPIDPRVVQAMEPYHAALFGNPSSVAHSYGWESKAAIDEARKAASALINAKPAEIVWTSGATESNNLAILGVLRSFLRRGEKPHVISTCIEHKAVCDVVSAIGREGADITFLTPDAQGVISAQKVKDAIKPNTKLVSVIMAQNEIGTINPVAEIGALCSEKGILFHTDCAQSLGKIPIDVQAMKIDLLSASAHKIYGPKGVGFLYVGKQKGPVEMEPLMYGGQQEHGIRPGTHNVGGIVGFGKACEIAREEMADETRKLTELRDGFIKKILSHFDAAILNGHPTQRLPNNINISFKNLSSDLFALGLSGLALSSASACSGGAASYVLKAIGLNEELARSTIRIGIGRFTHPQDLEVAYAKIAKMIERNRLFSGE